MKNIAFLILALMASCSNLSKNVVEDGKFPIRNGVMADKMWKEDLILNRYSWYHELTLQFELLIGSITPQSGFNFWMSKSELNEFNSCKDARIVLAYSLDTKIIPYTALNDQFEANGFKKFEMPEFKKNLIQHPDSVMNSLKLYHVFGICRSFNDLSKIKIAFPGFSEKVLN